MRALSVELGARSYPIYIGPDLLSAHELFKPHICGRQVLVVTNDTVAPLYLDRLLATLQPWQTHTKILPDGESFKTIETWSSILDALIGVPCARDTTLIALGGGVIGDISGFAAACYQRGIGYIQAPTTLLAQVDSSVGGKTAVNHVLGKNIIGAFYQPSAVIADTRTLETLDDRELRAGIAEVIKYGLICDYEFFAWLEENMPALVGRDSDALTYAIERSCQNKSEVVGADERELGRRAILNLGHTFGHAIETSVGYGEWLHGEAVAAGMVMAAAMSQRLGELTDADCERIERLIGRAGLPTRPPVGLDDDTFLQRMAVDKKVRGGRIRLVLLRAIGDAYINDDYPDTVLEQTLRQARSGP
ncbi:MAG: 3-dehydroquinate synthase [Gammaproteobacteria bacterium]|nr:3-dehydroquinate synthase [Gammaproteobacteria bacterium]